LGYTNWGRHKKRGSSSTGRHWFMRRLNDTLLCTYFHWSSGYVMMPCSLAGGYQYCREACCLHLRGNRGTDLPKYMASHTRYCNIEFKNSFFKTVYLDCVKISTHKNELALSLYF
jgi:hypothetical protein